MYALHLIIAFTAFLIIYLYITDFKWDIRIENSAILLIFIAIFVRILATFISDGHPNDILNFKSWGETIRLTGFNSFYSSSKEIFVDYPPGYMYVLYALTFIKGILSIGEGFFHTLLIKSPAIICDTITGVLIFIWSKKHMRRESAWLISLVYILNPAILINSAVWGQIESVYMLFIVLSLFFQSQKKLLHSFVFFIIALLIKSYTIIFIPIYVFLLFEYFIENGFGKKVISKTLDGFFVCVFVIILFLLPFTVNFDATPIFSQYFSTQEVYNYTSLNAYNIYGLIGSIGVSLSTNQTLYFTINTVVIFMIFSISIYLLYRNRTKSNVFFVAGLISTCSFMFLTRIHERYLFAAIPLFLLAYVYKRDKRILLLFLGFSITSFVNVSDILYMVLKALDLKALENSLYLVSFINILLCIFMFYTAFKVYKKDEIDIVSDVFKKKEKIPHFNDFKIEKSKLFSKLSLKDYTFILVITTIYSFIAFYGLGNTYSPETLYEFGSEERVYFELPENEHISRMQYFVGLELSKEFNVSISNDNENWTSVSDMETKGVFSWKEIEVNQNAKYISIESKSSNFSLFEIAVRNKEEELLSLKTRTLALVDEQSMVPYANSHKNSTYFDEIYHARTAYEIINGIKIYENTHPPLGKVIIAIGIKIFGMNPFGWRFMGTLCGILMVPLLYVFARRMFNSSNWALFATIVFTFDFMHFSQTRIATIDSYTCFFIMMMYYFMYKYSKLSFYDTPLYKTFVPLVLSGVFMGLSMATKWQGVYAVSGIAIVFFYTIYKRYREYIYAKDNKIKSITDVFSTYVIKTFLCCIVFFIIIPVGIYLISYIPYFNTPQYNTFSDILKNQLSMFNYHSSLVSTHPYASEWWKWPLIVRPIFYFSQTLQDGFKVGISSFGNPSVWWVGIPAFLYMIYLLHFNKSKRALFLIVAYFAQYLPWLFITRTTYIYHYLPSVPFIVLMITYMFRNNLFRKSRKLPLTYLIIVIVLFAMFYPVIAGVAVPEWYVNTFIKWLPTWQLIL